ncbi:MFS transporter [Arenibaculum sp.]|jgi:MFS family permease|uniref:MFS transporter n=1 Tax=Arenibaculum sp. TaxID=2865862 RepID=UPI002E0DA5B2|nr:MFS transporter [Arenibaculum sp.]
MTRTERIWARRWLIVLAAGVIMGSSLGVRHVQGLFLPPITFDQGWSRESFAFTLAMQNLIWGLAQPFTGMIADRFGSLKVLISGMLLYALGLFVMANSETTGLFLMGNGVLIGIALSGTAFGAVYGTLSRIFPPEHRSWALGVAGAIGGLGQFAMVPLAQGLLDGMGWVSTLVVLAVVMVVLTPLVVWMRDDPEGERQEGTRNQSMMQAIREAGGHRGFLLLNLGFVACGFQLAFIASHMPAYLIDGGLGPREASIALALITLSNIVGTYLGGYLGGFLRRKYVLSAVYATRAVAMALFIAFPLTAASTYIFSFVMGLLWLGVVPLTTGLISQIFGVRYITTLFGFVFFGHQVGSFFGVWLGGYVFDATQSYDLVWFGAIALGVFAAVMHLPINDANVTSTRPVAQPA